MGIGNESHGRMGMAEESPYRGGAGVDKNVLRPPSQHGDQGVAMNPFKRIGPSTAAWILWSAMAPAAYGATAAELEAGYTALAGAPAVAARGRDLFTTRHGREWSCSSCHGATPTRTGSHAATGKSISALAPALNAERFTDTAKTEKWFRRNCNDVMGRECTPAEKADVINWLRTLKA
jgi:mono/diheme cytochrome c family protein